MQTIELTVDVRQDAALNHSALESAAAYLVFDTNTDSHLFHEFSGAESFAIRQAKARGDGKPWDVFPLFATHPIEVEKQ